MPQSIRFVMLGGFLGAGKTTSIARLANGYQEEGLRVGIVTNDQAADLVDTHLLRSKGFDVGEVAGACFCCNFAELTDVVAELGQESRPDVVLAEPVGSCTDLVATVIQPLRRLFDGEFDVAPYGVLLKPSHGRRILRNEPNSGFSPQAAYIFRKQLEEADFIVVNRIDQLTAAEVSELEELLRRDYPDVPLLKTSAVSGEGFAALREMLDQRGDFGRRILDLDYDIYAAGEADLGWLNSRFVVTADAPFSLDDFQLQLVECLRQKLCEENAEAAHLKAIGIANDGQAVVNLVSNDSPAELSLACGSRTTRAELVVNARVAIDPARLAELVEEAAARCSAKISAGISDRRTQSFRPGRPVPTHRFAAE